MVELYASFIGIGFAAMFMHAVKKYLNGEISGDFLNWYKDHPRATANAMLTMLGGILSALLTEQLTDPFAGVQIIAAWGIGYAADTLNNQGKE